MNTRTSYSEQLKHPNWQRRRLEMLNAAEFTCTACGETEDTLHVHHKHYKKGAKVWEYSDAELMVLCESCHSEEHQRSDLVLSIIKTIPFSVRNEFTGVLAGMSFCYSKNDVVNNGNIGEFDPLAFMAGISAVNMREFDLISMNLLSKFMDEQIKDTRARAALRSEKSKGKGFN